MKNAHICADCAAYLPTSRWRKSDSDHVMKKTTTFQRITYLSTLRRRNIDANCVTIRAISVIVSPGAH
ncbi:Hypothetical protein ABZS17I87_02552 [Kosakonia cowanii]